MSRTPYITVTMNTSVVFRSPRPQIAIHLLYARDEGGCVKTTFYKIISLFRLSKDSINRIRHAYLIGGGQEWCIKSQHDGKELPAGTDLVSAIEINNSDGTIVNEDPIHSYTGGKFKPIEIPYYEYLIEDMCDSSD